MIHNSTHRKGFAPVLMILGVAVTVVAAVVLVLGVQRIQDLRTVLQRPKAAGTITWPSCVQDQSKAYWCTNDDCFNSTNDKRNINKCCSQVKNDPFACDWPARGWCKPPPEQCPDSGGQRCGLYFFNSDSGCYGYNSGGGGNGNPCWTNQPIPKSWNESGLSWSWNKTYATVSYANVYVWKDPNRTGNADAQAAAGGSDLSSVKVSDFSPALAANTKYYVKVNPNGYSSPDPAKYQCMDDATKNWTFTTGAGTILECTTDAQCADDKKCDLTTNKCVVPVCSPAPGVCQTAQYKNHACSLANKADGTACETNKVCSAGVCVNSEVNACWDNKGVNGKCYDCNGDGTINILDFSCFQKHWLENVQ
ncbi:hypothetical protein HY085_01620 [Candidatus Gottesmanbacteria bacterium]|nr:hypothetical protein [Candidatus Gottesmanbacteria bacterium]